MAVGSESNLKGQERTWPGRRPSRGEAQEMCPQGGRCPECIIGADFLSESLELVSQGQTPSLGPGDPTPKRSSQLLAEKNVGEEGDGS